MTAAFMARDLAGAAKAVGSAALGATTIFARLGAGITGMTIAGIGGLMRLRNFLGKLGDVGKASFHKMFEAHGLFVGAILGGVKIVGALTGAVLRVGTLGAFGKASADVAKFGAETRTSAAQVEALTGKVRSLGSEVLAAFGLAGLIYKAVGFIRDGVMAASDLNEAVSRSKVVFGDSFGAVDEQARRMTRAFGLSHQAQLDIASGFGAMTQGAGFSEAASARLSNQLTKMAADLSSSVNIPFEEAGAALRSALAGEAEPLRRFGVNVTETNVKTYALANGIATSAKSMTDMQKVAARAAIIMNGLSYAQDDLENTASSASNQFRMAGGGIAEFGSRIGEILLPAVNLGTQAFNTFLGAVLDLFEASMPTIRAGMEYLSAGMEMVGMVARNFGDFFTVAKLRVGEFAANAVAWIGTIPENFGPITEWLGRNWWNLLTDMVNLTASAFKNLITNAANLGKAIWNALSGQPWSFAWTPLLDGFKATTEKLPDLIRPDLISVDDEVNRILERIGKKEFERSQALANAASPKKPIVPLAASDSKDSNYRLASAVEVGSKEAYSIVARTLAPGGNDPGRQQVDLIRQTNGILGQIRDGVNKNAPAQFSVV